MKKLLRLGKSLFKLFILRQKVPLFVQMLLTNRCTVLCSYCEIPLREHDDLSTEQILKLLDELAEAGTYRIGFYGGEPLLRNDIYEIVSYAKNLGLMVQLYTNGNTTLVKRHIEAIKLLDGIFFSLDGPQEINDEFRGAGAHQMVMESVNLCRKYIPIYFLSVLTRENKDCVEYISNLAKELEAPVSFQGVFEVPGVTFFNAYFD